MRTDLPPSSRDRFLAYLRGSADGTPGQRVRFYGSRLAAGAIAGFFVIALATSTRDGQHTSLSLNLYLGAMGAGAGLALVMTTVPRLIRPKDWPTLDEFRRQPPPSRDPPSHDPAPHDPPPRRDETAPR